MVYRMKSRYRAAVTLSVIFILSGPVRAQKKEAQVQFSAATTEVAARYGKDTKRLIGDVMFIHEGAKMYCDSAYFYSSRNSLDAYSNVYINQGDTVHLYGDHLYYDGNTKVARMNRNVKLINRETTLTTDELDYNISDGIGYYTRHADIVNVENHLESVIGYYHTRSDLFDFQDNVVITNPDYRILSDRMKYNTITKVAFFMGPTEIFSDSSYIYCERGWYNTETDISQLNQNALVRSKTQTIKGDSLYYEKVNGFGRAIGNVEIIDTAENMILRGKRGIYYENPEYAVLTEFAEFIQVSGSGDSIHLHADTLLSVIDTSDVKHIKAFHGVRIFRNDMQGRCDSLDYSLSDSVIRLFYEPVLWFEESQITADYIELHTERRQPKTMYLYNSSFIISQEEKDKFNQIKGKNMVCHFRKNELYRIDVKGNGQAVYYPKDNDGIIGANKAECSDMIIYVKNGNPKSISLLKKPDAMLYPLETAPVNELLLKGFKWQENLRPLSKQDIFNK